MNKQEKIIRKESSNKITLDKIVGGGSKFIDYKMGAAGAIVMGIIVFGVNYYGAHELTGASTAALKQATYTFLFGGIIMRTCETLATKINKQWIAFDSGYYYSVFSSNWINIWRSQPERHTKTGCIHNTNSHPCNSFHSSMGIQKTETIYLKSSSKSQILIPKS